jgi:hypothetical protein
MTGSSPADVGVSNDEMMTGPVAVLQPVRGAAHFSVVVRHQ